MNLRTLLFLARKDLFKDLWVLLLVLLAVGSGALAIIPLNGLMEGFIAHMSATTVDVSISHVIVSPAEDEPYIEQAEEVRGELEGLGDVAGISVARRFTSESHGASRVQVENRGIHLSVL